MSAIGAWLLSILGIVVLGIVFDLILANTRLHKTIQTVFAAVTILIVVTPIPSLIKGGFGLDGKNIFNSEIKLDSSYLDYVNDYKIKTMEKGVVDALAADGFKKTIVTIEAEFGNEITIKNVGVNLKNLVIDKDYLHINKYEYVKEKVSSYLKIEKGIISVYE